MNYSPARPEGAQLSLSLGGRRGRGRGRGRGREVARFGRHFETRVAGWTKMVSVSKKT